MRKPHCYMICALFMMCLASCSEEMYRQGSTETFREIEPKAVADFFSFTNPQTRSASHAHQGISRVISILRSQDDVLDRVNSFKEKYGNPLWNEAIVAQADSNGDSLIFVPIVNDGKDEILSIWKFRKAESWNNYVYELPHSLFFHDYSWKQAYFTRKIKNVKPLNRLNFKQVAETRQQSEPCVDTYIEITVGDDTYTRYLGRHCWGEDDRGDVESDDEDDYVLNFDSGFDNEGGSHHGGGGGNNYSSGNSGGSSGSGNNSLPGSIVLSRYFSNSTLTEHFNQLVESVLLELEDQCPFQTLNTLFHIDNLQLKPMSQSDDAADMMFTSRNVLKVKEDASKITPMNVFHEWFHMFQQSSGGDIFNPLKTVYAEFERAIFEDICSFVSEGRQEVKQTLQSQRWYHKNMTPGSDVDIDIVRYYDDYLKRICKNGNTFRFPNSISTLDITACFLEFKDKSTYGIMSNSFDPNFSTSIINQALSAVAENCN